MFRQQSGDGFENFRWRIIRIRGQLLSARQLVHPHVGVVAAFQAPAQLVARNVRRRFGRQSVDGIEPFLRVRGRFPGVPLSSGLPTTCHACACQFNDDPPESCLVSVEASVGPMAIFNPTRSRKQRRHERLSQAAFLRANAGLKSTRKDLSCQWLASLDPIGQAACRIGAGI